MADEIIFKNIPINFDKSIIELLFTHKKYGNHDILNFEEIIDTENNVKSVIIKLDSENAVQDILQIGPSSFQGLQLVPLLHISKDSESEILINNVEESELEYLLLLYENEKKSGGDTIVDSFYDDNKKSLTIKYESDEVAKRVIAKGSVSYKNKTYTALPASAQKPKDSNWIVIENVDERDEDIVLLIYENESKSGGGDIKDHKYDKEKKQLRIFYADTNVADRVLKFGPTKLAGKTYQAKIFKDEKSEPFLKPKPVPKTQPVLKPVENIKKQPVLKLIENIRNDKISMINSIENFEKIDSIDNTEDDDDDDDDDDTDKADSIDTQSICSSASSQARKHEHKYYKPIVLGRSKYLKKSIISRLQCLKNSLNGDIDALINDDKKHHINLLIKIRTNNKDAFDKAINEINKWRVWVRRIYLQDYEMAQLKEHERALKIYISSNKNIHNKDYFIKFNFNKGKNEIVMYSLDKTQVDDIEYAVKKFSFDKINLYKHLKLKNDDEFELIKYLLNNQEYLKLSNYDKCKFDYNDSTNTLKLTTTKAHFDLIDIEKLKNISCISENITNNSRHVGTAVKYRLKPFQTRLLDKNFCLLKYNENVSPNNNNNNSKIEFSVKVYGHNEDDVKEYFNKVKFFIANAKSLMIPLNKYGNLDRVKENVELFKKDQLVKNTDDELNAIDVNLSVEAKKLFINGTDDNELKELRDVLLKNIEDSLVVNRAIKIRMLVYGKLLDEGNKRLFNKLKTGSKSKKLDILTKFNQNGIIRVVGEKDEVDAAVQEIMQLSDSLCNQVLSVSMDFKNKEYLYLLNKKHDISQINRSCNVNINLTGYEKCFNLKISNSHEITLYCGDLTGLFVDAYVNPANVDLKHVGGLAKAIVDAGSNIIQNECDDYIRLKGRLNEGDVFVSSSGLLGLNSKCIIIHAAGPVWKGGSNNESYNLAKVINLCLKEADKRSCTSIAIPPISTGIYNYPLADALKIITQTTIDFIKTNQKTKIQNVIFVSNVKSACDQWMSIMKKPDRNLFGKITSIFNYMTSSRQSDPTEIKPNQAVTWYWKDDEDKWKAFMSKYNNLIQVNYENKKFKFDLNINGKDYVFDLIKNLQINKSTGHHRMITNKLPSVLKQQWYWQDDRKKRSPYSIDHSNKIEDAFSLGRMFIDIQIKRHDNDINTDYRVFFKTVDSIKQRMIELNADGIQINIATQHQCLIFRHEYSIQPEITEEIEVEEDTVLASNNDESCNNKTLFIAGFQQDIKNAQKKLESFIKDAYVQETFPLFDTSINEIRRLERVYDAKITVINNNQDINIICMKDTIDQIKSCILKNAVTSTNNMKKLKLPTEWTTMNESEKISKIQVLSNTIEYHDIVRRISETLPGANICSIERIQNKWLWKLYQKEIDNLKEKGLKSENEKWLFHGCRSTDPEKIYNGEVGFDMRFSNSGMWGKGIYFAVNASYSKNGYAYKNSNGTVSIFYARVALGDVTEQQPNQAFNLPPVKPKSDKFAEERYDSIKGNTGGSDVFIVYENRRAYPAYFITFSS